MELLERASKYVGLMAPAVSGSGGHDATFYVACVLVQGFGLSPSQAWPIMAEYNQRCSPPWKDADLKHKLESAEKTPGKKPRGWLAKGEDWKPSKKWQEDHKIEPKQKVEFDAAKLQRFAGDLAGAVDLAYLANRSVYDPATVTADDFLRMMYQPGEKVAIFTQERAATIGDGVEIWPDTPANLRGSDTRPCGVWFLAQPVTGKYHPTDEGDKQSCRNHRAVTAWRYLVIESDEADTWQWLAALVQLPLRISAIYSSGSRSVHALVRLDADSKADWDRVRDEFRDPVAVLGGDPKTLTAVRLTRLPGAVRAGKMVEDKYPDGTKSRRYHKFPSPRLQKLLYVNPTPSALAIEDILPIRNVEKVWCDLAAAGVADSDETRGQAIREALAYYAPVSDRAKEMLAKLEGGER